MPDISIVAEQVRARSRELVRELGFMENDCLGTNLTHAEFHSIYELQAGRSSTPSDLGVSLGLDKSKVTRTLKQLESKGFVDVGVGKQDARRKSVTVTDEGEDEFRRVDQLATQIVESALELMDRDKRSALVEALTEYVEALRRSAVQRQYSIAPIGPEHNATVKRMIWTVLASFGATGEGFACHDDEVNDIASSYAKSGWQYWVILEDGKVVGGGGIGHLAGGSKHMCELKKMYFSEKLRGKGMGSKLLTLLLQKARELGYKQCYLETLTRMYAARGLYEKFGFRRIPASMGSTGHDQACDVYYLLDL